MLVNKFCPTCVCPRQTNTIELKKRERLRIAMRDNGIRHVHWSFKETASYGWTMMLVL